MKKSRGANPKRGNVPRRYLPLRLVTNFWTAGRVVGRKIFTSKMNSGITSSSSAPRAHLLAGGACHQLSKVSRLAGCTDTTETCSSWFGGIVTAWSWSETVNPPIVFFLKILSAIRWLLPASIIAIFCG